MKARRFKMGVVGLVTSALITTASFTGANADAASIHKLNAQSFAPSWQTAIIQKIADQLGIVVDEKKGTLSYRSITVNLQDIEKNLKVVVKPITVKQPQPTVTPAPTKAPQPTVTPAPTKAPQPTVTPAPTKAPQPTVTPAPTKAPQPTVTPAPTKAPQPTVTPAPTKAPQPTVTPAPTKAPQPTVTPAPTKAPQPTVTPAPTTGAQFSEAQEAILELVNKEREKAGLKAMKLDKKLSEVATEKARDMADNNYFSHNSPTYGSPFDMMAQFNVTYSYAGENIAYGQPTPEKVMTDWMNSPGHKANILNPNFTTLGVGYVKDRWVQMFIG